MGDLDAFTFTGKDNRVITNHIAPAKRCKADGTVFTRPGMAVTGANRHIVKFDTPAFCRGLTKAKCGARRRIDLVLVMHFDDFDIGHILVQDTCDLFDQCEGKVHADTHIRRKDDRGLLGSDFQLVLLIIGKPGGPDHKDRPGFRSQLRVFHGCGRGGEINHRIDGFEQGLGIISDQNAAFFQTGNQGDVLANERASRKIRTATDFAALGFGSFIHQHPAHTARTSNNPDLHFRSPSNKACKLCLCFITSPRSGKTKPLTGMSGVLIVSFH